MFPWRLHFPFTKDRLYRSVPGSPGYGDKLRCVIDAADPGAVPGSSTISPGFPGVLMGLN